MPELDFATLPRLSKGMAFLDDHGWEKAVIYPIAGDASFRRYARIQGENRDAILMDAPPQHEDVQAFVQIANHLRDLGFSAPEIFAQDLREGFLLLEDLGAETFTQALGDNSATEQQLYELATDTLARLHKINSKTTAPDWLAPYDDEKLLAEAALFADWFMPAVGIDNISGLARADFDKAWLEVFTTVHRGPRTLVLRDFHVDNLVRMPSRKGTDACGLLDFQDAVAGHPAYDLMSLLQDARRDVSDDLKADMLARYHDAMGTLDRKAFDAVFAILAAQRHAKVIGIFTRLHVRDGKPHYLAHISRVWKLLDDALNHPALGPVASWLETHVPPEKRITPDQAGAKP